MFVTVTALSAGMMMIRGLLRTGIYGYASKEVMQGVISKGIIWVRFRGGSVRGDVRVCLRRGCDVRGRLRRGCDVRGRLKRGCDVRGHVRRGCNVRGSSQKGLRCEGSSQKG